MDYKITRYILTYIKRYWLIYSALGIILIANIVTSLLFAWFLQNITDSAINGEIDAVKSFFIIGIFLIILLVVFQYLSTFLEALTVTKVKTRIKNDLYAHLLKLPLTFHSGKHSGDLISRLTNDINALNGVIGSNVINLIKHPLTAIATFVYLVSLNWQLALISVVMGPLAVLFGSIIGKFIRSNAQDIQSKVGKMNGFLQDTISNFLVTRAFELEKHFTEKFHLQNRSIQNLEIKEGRLRGLLQSSLTGMSILAQMAVLGLGAFFVVNGQITMGSLIAFISLTQNLMIPFSSMSQLWATFQRSLASVERIFDVMNEPTKFTNETHHDLMKKNNSPNIEFKDVSFSYDNNNNMVINHFNLVIEAGKSVAIVGESGAGKSTIFNLALGFYEPTSGKILVNGMELSSSHVLRKFLSIVPQEPYLYSGTIKENISFGNLHSSEQDILEAAAIANADNFINQLPDGFDTEIGERGAKLSGGQKQRIAIARAILKEAPILLLDEATSALDSKSEAEIQESFKKLMGVKTTIVIAHRLSTIQNFDEIVVIDNGEVIEKGTHIQLLEMKGKYYKLYNLQYKLEANIEG